MNYNKTVSYLRASHETPQIKTTRDLNLTLEDDENKVFDQQLSQEIEKFNATKKLKQVTASVAMSCKSYVSNIERSFEKI